MMLGTIENWMTKNPKTVTPETSVRDAFVQMRKSGFRHLPVVQNGKLLGIVTDRDLRRPDVSDSVEGWNDFYDLDEGREVRYVMTTDVTILRPDNPLRDAIHIFAQRKFGAIPILDHQERLVGILSTFDIMKALDKSLQQSGNTMARMGTKQEK